MVFIENQFIIIKVNWIKNRLRKLKSKHPEKSYNSGKPFDEIYNDLGAFGYDASGFTLCYEETSKRYEWDSITQINVFKYDLYAIDRLKWK